MNTAVCPIRAAQVAADALAAETRRQRVLRMLAANAHAMLPVDVGLIRLALKLNDEALQLTGRVLAVNFEAANDERI